MKGMKKAEEKRSALGDGRRNAEGLKRSGQASTLFFSASASSTVEKR
jgi:hypothetical protein